MEQLYFHKKLKDNKSAYTYNGLGLRVNNTQTTHAGKVYARNYVIDYTSFENDDLMVFAEGNGQLEYEQKHVYAGSERIEQLTDNPLRDTLFTGKEDLYYGLEMASTLIASAGTAAFRNFDMESEINASKMAEYGKRGYFWGGSGDVRSKFNKLLNSDYYKTDFGYDCSEIAQDFYDAAGQKGKIYRIEGKGGMNTIIKQNIFITKYIQTEHSFMIQDTKMSLY